MVDFLAVYTKVVDKVKTQYSSIEHSAVYKNVVEKSPAIFIREVGNAEITGIADFTRSDNHCRMTVEVQAMSNKKSGSLAEARAVMNLCNTAMKEMHFIRSSSQPLDTADKVGTRLVSRYSRIFGDDDTI